MTFLLKGEFFQTLYFALLSFERDSCEHQGQYDGNDVCHRGGQLAWQTAEQNDLWHTSKLACVERWKRSFAYVLPRALCYHHDHDILCN
jgi:hypothetical protein